MIEPALQLESIQQSLDSEHEMELKEEVVYIWLSSHQSSYFHIKKIEIP